jgi:phosphoribosylaminoimidazolecarboxamide formyltransferase / IMP cyclohydrolase
VSQRALRVARALLSVSDKTGLLPFAQGLVAHGVELVSTGGTAKMLAEAGLAVKDVSDLTGFPEMMDGRLKTLHPKVHGGLLAIRGEPEHEASMLAHGIVPIDLLVVNLYPFEATVAKGADFETCVENIDIGGPAMIRAASKNHEHVAVVMEVSDYDRVLSDMAAHQGAVSLELKRQLAAKAFALTGAYDAAIAQWFHGQLAPGTMPSVLTLAGKLSEELRYGENPHQSAAFYKTADQRFGVASSRLMQGKALSFNNINDTDAAFELVAECNADNVAACAIIKHANPCGMAQADTLLGAYEKALASDPVSAFGGVVAVNRRLDKATAEAMVKIFTEVVIAPDADEEAIAVFAAKKNLRLLLTGGVPNPADYGVLVRSVAGGILALGRDTARADDETFTLVTKRALNLDEERDLRFALKVVKHAKSNAIVIARHDATLGIGAGQTSRVDAVHQALSKACASAGVGEGGLPEGTVLASDAFFPFPDGLVAAAEAGVRAIVQPGGSIKDAEVIAAADAHGIAMVFTGIRHFKH